jgi:S-adenosylmethionine:tRNA ribosyltransferase-isomerase
MNNETALPPVAFDPDLISEYEYELPDALIAQSPLPRRDESRLMVVRKAAGTIQHHHVADLPQLLRPGDLLVLNDSRVLPARLVGKRDSTGARWQGLFLDADETGSWRLMAKTRGTIHPGEKVTLTDRTGEHRVQLTMLAKIKDGLWAARPDSTEPPFEILRRIGRVPLPAYIRKGAMMDSDLADYQTVYAAKPGSVAAPTAGLHFTTGLIRELIDAGVAITRVTLHVGIGTFRPVKADRLSHHLMHAERGQLDEKAVQQIAACRERGGRVVAVGTTTTRVLESVTRDGPLRAWSGESELFIHPPFEFRAIDGLMTNFHLSRSTLLVLVRTFGGDALVRRAYEEAISMRYRFYSYGDAMLILPE